MSFASPAYLWILTALLPLLAIYFLKIKPRRLEVNAFFLWESILKERRASLLFQRLRDLLSLLLLALVVAALAFAAADPRFETGDQRDLLILVDVSPSMRAKHSGKEVALLAKNRAREIIRALNGTRRTALAIASGELRFLCHLSTAPKDVLDALARVEVSDVPVSDSTIRTINALASKGDHGPRLLLLTDGHGGWEGLDPSIEVIRLGGRSRNAGIVGADLTWAASGGDKARFFYRIASSLTEETHGELELRHQNNGDLARLVPVLLQPGKEVSDTLDVEHAAPGTWKVSLKLVDSLATDNEVDLGLAERRPVGIRIDAEDDYFYNRSVEAFAQTGGSLARVESGGEIAITQGAASNDDRQIVFAPKGESPFWSDVGATIDVLAVERTVEGHPLVRNLDVEAIRFDGARKVEPAPGSLVLVRSESGDPLLWKAQVGERTAVVVNLDPALGDFFLSPWFPALIHDSAKHLADREASLSSVYPTGSRVSSSGVFAAPCGRTSRDSIQLVHRGILHLQQGGTNIPFGAALLSEVETKLDGSGPKAHASSIARGNPIAFWLMLLAVGILILESLLYHHRKAG